MKAVALFVLLAAYFAIAALGSAKRIDRLVCLTMVALLLWAAFDAWKDRV